MISQHRNNKPRITSSKAASSYSDVELLINKKIGWIFYGLVVVFWLGQIWCSPYAEFDNHLGTGSIYGSYLNPLMRIIDRVLDQPSLVGNRFSLYEVSLVALAAYLIVAFRKYMRIERFYAIFFYISMLVVLVSLLNPNNSFTEIKYLLTIEPRIMYVYLLFLLAFTFLRVDILSIILKKFFRIGAISAISLAAYSLFAFLIRKGPMFYGHMTTLPNSENLDWMVIFSTIFLGLYFNTEKKSYLVYVLLFHLVVVFGDRRAQTAALIASDIMLVVYFFKRDIFLKSKKFLIPGSILFITVFIMTLILKVDVGYFFERFYAVLSPQKYYYGWFSDMGHWDQTTTTFKTLLDNWDQFWGAGMRNEMNYVEGQSAYIHNSFVVVWAIYGLHMTLFFIFLFLLFLKKTISLYCKKINESNMIVAAVTFTYLMIIVGGGFTGEYIFKHFIYATQFVLILSVFKISKLRTLEFSFPRKTER